MRENVCSKQFFYKSDKLALSVCGSAVSISPSDRQDRRSYAKIDLFIAESPSLVQRGCTTGHKTWYSHGNISCSVMRPYIQSADLGPGYTNLDFSPNSKATQICVWLPRNCRFIRALAFCQPLFLPFCRFSRWTTKKY